MDDDEDIIPEIEQATQHYCDKNNCEDLPATQLLKIKVIISIIIEKYKFFFLITRTIFSHSRSEQFWYSHLFLLK